MTQPNSEFYDWISLHADDDPAQLRLKYAGEAAKSLPFDVALAIVQIECRRKYASKFAWTLERDPLFLFPDRIAAEQATSDRLAAWHVGLAGDSVGSLVDMTAGLGIDASHFACAGWSVKAWEIRPEAASALRYNSARISADFEAIEGDSVDALSAGRITADAIWIDPARRRTDGSRAFALADCLPDVPALMPDLQRHCSKLLVKMSPMLDITHTTLTLGPHLRRIVALGTPTECKELLAVVDFTTEDPTEGPLIQGVTLMADGTEQSVTFTADTARQAQVNYAAPRPGQYLCEPYPSTVKSGASRVLAQQFGVVKLHANTQLYLADHQPTNFPGTAREIVEVLPYASKVIKCLHSRWPRIEVATRNFGMSAQELIKRLGVTDAKATARLIGATGPDGQRVMIVVKI